MANQVVFEEDVIEGGKIRTWCFSYPQKLLSACGNSFNIRKCEWCSICSVFCLLLAALVSSEPTTTVPFPFSNYTFQNKIYLFGCREWVLVVALRIFDLPCGTQDLFWTQLRHSLCHGMCDLVPWPGFEPGPPALGALSLNHWTTKEVPPTSLFKKNFLFFIKI